jgi:2-polyprenyl-3-methyl-5-hydroxy-6-metoxy-1,4-benzoquinol methylase
MIQKGNTTVRDGECTKFFGQQARHWAALYETKIQFRDRLNLFMNGVRKYVPKPARVLDFGCGPGILSNAMARQGYVVTGVDGSDHMIDVARQMHLGKEVPGLSFAVMGSEAFSLHPGSYDAVVCSSVLEYVEDDALLLRNLIGVLRPGGVLFISVPHTASLLGKIEDLTVRLRDAWQESRCTDHDYSRRRYRIKSLIASLEGCSMGVVESTFFEIPLLGKSGVWLSRFRRLGLMVLVTAIKENPDATTGVW